MLTLTNVSDFNGDDEIDDSPDSDEDDGGSRKEGERFPRNPRLLQLSSFGSLNQNIIRWAHFMERLLVVRLGRTLVSCYGWLVFP